MLTFLKLLHFVSFAAGLGFGLANIVVMRSIPLAASDDARLALSRLQKLNSRIAFGGVCLLWVTGLWLYSVKYAGVGLGWTFHGKIGVAVVLTGLAAGAQWLMWRASRAATPPPAGIMRFIGMSVPILAIITAGLAVYAFA